MDDTLIELVKRVIRDDLGTILSDELQVRLKPFLDKVDMVLTGQDKITEQLRTDRTDINTNTSDLSTIKTRIGIMISNDSHQEDRVTEAVEEAAKEIPNQVKEAVQETLKDKSFIEKILK